MPNVSPMKPIIDRNITTKQLAHNFAKTLGKTNKDAVMAELEKS